ncbi:MAG: hypothetical protein DRI26_05395 [Chloroflexi bacterium]|nr:MAG: hypothetical protein DRI26_05395 [Chloroflexota bacterium]
MNKERISVALSKDVLERVEVEWRSRRKFRSRSHFIEEAIENFLLLLEDEEGRYSRTTRITPVLRRVPYR